MCSEFSALSTEGVFPPTEERSAIDVPALMLGVNTVP
ncbi:hypothetical protein ZBT109_0567 [Zymobacter palmae]|uniref:Uncharacterized protein n=1 Tax=Zymobacter palmae TaxID=33074 RepID=A0A348HCK3_9GAMM|nr:hypothetical protein ZBT109_0567 [Zymobacter palmae]